MHPDIREIFHELRQHKEELVRAIQRIETMNSAEQAAFDGLNGKVDTLTGTVTSLATAVTGLTTAVSTEAQQLKDALADSDSDGIVAAASALSAKLDAGTAAAQTALTAAQAALTPAPATPATPPAAPAAS